MHGAEVQTTVRPEAEVVSGHLTEAMLKDHEVYRRGCLNMIASENITSPAVTRLLTNDLSHRYGWRPERTYEQFIEDRLAAACGGAQRARRFLALLRNTTRAADEIEADRQSTLAAAGEPDLEPRQQIRWRNLADELARRRRLAEDPATFKASP